MKIGKTGILITDILKTVEKGAGHEDILTKYPELSGQDICNSMRIVSVYIWQHMLIDVWLNINFSQKAKPDFKRNWEVDEKDELRNLFVNKISIHEISKLLNRDQWDILSKLKEFGVLNE